MVSSISSVLILLLCTPLFNNRYKAKWKYWVWLIIAIRLAVPMGFTLPQFQISVELPEVMVIYDVTIAELFLTQAQDSPVATPSPPAGGLRSVTLYQVLFFIWAFGFVLFVSLQLTRYFKTRKNFLRWSVESNNIEIHAVIAELTREMGIKKSIIPMINSEIVSPMIMGLMRPVLILPYEEYGEIDLRFILRHEFTHFKNKDILYKIILFIANAVHWFNPIVYFMVAEAHADLEKVCDDEVIRNRGLEERREYSEVILNSIGQRKMRGGVLTTNFYTNTKKIKARFMNIMDMKKRKSGFAGLFVVAFAAIMISAINPAMGYATARDTIRHDVTHSFTFTQTTMDAMAIDNLEIHLLHGDIVVVINDEVAPASQVFLSGTTLGHTLTINPTTRTAYIYNNTQLPYGFGYNEEMPLFIIVSGEMEWAFEQANIHLEHGDIWYWHTHIEEFLARNLNISLPRGSILNQIPEIPEYELNEHGLIPLE